ncbi:MAG TPA: dTMP kinase [Desulfobacteraceae bacterium]|nr:dTMP kinase [Desulfobacteraceae bacterium]
MTSGLSGKFLVFEGIDGSGKTTQSREIARRIEASGLTVCPTCEPTDGPIGKLIRQMLSGELPVDQRTIASLFAADRTDHLVHPDTGVKALVDKGNIVVCDRYYFSSYAYHARYIDMEWVIEANRLNADILRPDATLFIDVDPDVCLKRIQARCEQLEIYEKIDIMKEVRANYFDAFDRLKDQETVIVIDGNADPETVANRVWEQVSKLLGL